MKHFYSTLKRGPNFQIDEKGADATLVNFSGEGVLHFLAAFNSSIFDGLAEMSKIKKRDEIKNR